MKGGEGGALILQVGCGVVEWQTRLTQQHNHTCHSQRTRTGPNGPWETGAAFDRRRLSHPTPALSAYLVTELLTLRLVHFATASAFELQGLLVVGQICTPAHASAPGGRCRQTWQGDLRRRPCSASSASSANSGLDVPFCVWDFRSFVSIRTGRQTASHAGGRSFPVWIVLLVLFGARVVLT